MWNHLHAVAQIAQNITFVSLVWAVYFIIVISFVVVFKFFCFFILFFYSSFTLIRCLTGNLIENLVYLQYSVILFLPQIKKTKNKKKKMCLELRLVKKKKKKIFEESLRKEKEKKKAFPDFLSSAQKREVVGVLPFLSFLFNRGPDSAVSCVWNDSKKKVDFSQLCRFLQSGKDWFVFFFGKGTVCI